jgi:membrane protein required for colicin V production
MKGSEGCKERGGRKMDTFDIVVLAVIGMLTIIGFWKGMVRQVFGIAGIMAGCILAMQFSRPWAKFLTGVSPGAARIIAFIVIFIACVLIANLLARGVERLFAITRLGFLNRIGGGLFGFLKGLILISLTVIVLTTFFSVNKGFFENSSTIKYILPLTTTLKRITLEDIKSTYSEKVGSEKPAPPKQKWPKAKPLQ